MRRGLRAVTILLVAGTAQAGPLVGPPQVLNADAASDGQTEHTPAIASDGSGRWVAAWWSWEDADPDTQRIRAARSSDEGATWSAPVDVAISVAPEPFANLGDPALATDGKGRWTLIWSSSDPLGGTIGTDADMLVSTSTDTGATWSTPVPLNDNAASDSGDDSLQFTGVPALVADSNGTWVAVWASEDTLEGTLGDDYDLLFVRSTDGGLTWSSPAPLETTATADAGHDLAASLATDDAGNWVAVWYETPATPTGADLWTSHSVDGGATWSPPALVEDDVADAGLDFDPKIATDRKGTWLVTWSGRVPGSFWHDILVARSTDLGATFSAPVPIRSGPANQYEEWSPRIATDGTGLWIVVWTFEHYIDFNEHLDYEVLMAQSADAGSSWSPVQALNDDPWDDGDIDDVAPTVVSSRPGLWRVAWTTQAQIEPGIGTDFDLAIARLVVRELPGLGPTGVLLVAALVLGSGAAAARTARQRPAGPGRQARAFAAY